MNRRTLLTSAAPVIALSGWIVGAGTLWAAVGVFVAATAPAAVVAVAAFVAVATVSVAGTAGVLVVVDIVFDRLRCV